MLPAATRAAHTTRTGRAALRARAADGDDLGGLRGAFPLRAVRAVNARARINIRRVEVRRIRVPGVDVRGSLFARRLRVESAAFDDERRRGATHRAPGDEAQARERDAQNDRPRHAPPAKSLVARRAKASARPHTPAQARDSLATFRAEVWPVHPREISRDVCGRAAAAAAAAVVEVIFFARR